MFIMVNVVPRHKFADILERSTESSISGRAARFPANFPRPAQLPHRGDGEFQLGAGFPR